MTSYSDYKSKQQEWNQNGSAAVSTGSSTGKQRIICTRSPPNMNMSQTNRPGARVSFMGKASGTYQSQDGSGKARCLGRPMSRTASAESLEGSSYNIPMTQKESANQNVTMARSAASYRNASVPSSQNTSNTFSGSGQRPASSRQNNSMYNTPSPLSTRSAATRQGPSIRSSNRSNKTLQGHSRTAVDNESLQDTDDEGDAEPKRSIKCVIQSEGRDVPVVCEVEEVHQETIINESIKGPNKLLEMEAREREMLQRDLLAWQMARRKLLIHAAKITSRVTYSDDPTK